MSNAGIALSDNDFFSVELTASQFSRISRIVYERSGINFQLGKEGLVKGRLIKRLRHLRLTNFDSYLEYIQNAANSHELAVMIDALTTNKTSFFREPRHFDFLRMHILPRLQQHRLRLWSAACSSGEEPYSIAMQLREELPQVDSWDCRILATDISDRVLTKARQALYDEETVRGIPSALLCRYLTKVQSRPDIYRVNDNVRKMVTFAHLNLIEPWPMSGPFDVIFCRNVMIYFDKPTQKTLVYRFWRLLKPGGYLTVGHSECLMSASQEFKYAHPCQENTDGVFPGGSG
ncbi:MAG: protein-glutamate O-methyltransferase CheR, partial [Syntrophales bacterium LBB04]|nr:protein-glutamate O-methyltransferase CheR [Syntrophales bacterium LBB04]